VRATPELESLLAAAEAHCRRQGQAWTANRRFMLERLIEAARPMKAYELVALQHAAGRPSNPASVYQVLKVLQAAGLVGRVETLNAFYACSPGAPRQTLLVCRSCRRATPIELGVEGPLLAEARRHEFEPDDLVCEVVGICAACRAGAPNP
jgi:Fur family transcriptional regulator, zinc uptake regulator